MSSSKIDDKRSFPPDVEQLIIYEPHVPQKLSRAEVFKRSVVATSHVTLVLLIVITIALLYLPATPHSLSIFAKNSDFPLSGWHSRIKKYRGDFEPTFDSLAFVQLRNSRLVPEGFTVAFFEPNLVVDSRGIVSTVPQADWDGLTELTVRAVTELPETGEFMNQWRVHHDHAGWPIDWLRVKTVDGPMKDVAVYGWDGRSTTLEVPIGEYTVLPTLLRETFTLTREARSGFKKGEENRRMIEKIKSILPRVFEE